MIYARVVDGLVAELIEDGAVPIAERFAPAIVQDLVAVPQGVAVAERWRFAGGAFTAPEAASVHWRRIRPLALRQRMSPATRAAITLAASTALDAGDATLQVFLDDMATAREVNLDSGDLVAGVAMLLAAGLIDVTQRDALLADAGEGERA